LGGAGFSYSEVKTTAPDKFSVSPYGAAAGGSSVIDEARTRRQAISAPDHSFRE
jgi:hypothetical protein